MALKRSRIRKISESVLSVRLKAAEKLICSKDAISHDKHSQEVNFRFYKKKKQKKSNNSYCFFPLREKEPQALQKLSKKANDKQKTSAENKSFVWGKCLSFKATDFYIAPERGREEEGRRELKPQIVT